MAILDLGKVVPKKGVDYYTNEDKQEIVSETTSEVLSEISLPTKTSDLVNDSGFITNTTQNLTNYYLKNETYSQSQVNDLINAISTMTLEVVQTLPTQDISTTTIYLVPKQTVETQDIYDEFVYINNEWEHIGSTEIDLSNYYNKTQTDALLSGKQANITSSNKLNADLVDDTNSTNKFVTSAEKTTWNNKSDFSGNYNDLTNKPTIPTQLNQLSDDSTHRLVTDTEKSNWNAKVGTTNYATTDNSGVVKVNSQFGIYADNGTIKGSSKSYSDYTSLSNNLIISKATLENVIVGKELVNQTTLDNSFEMTKTADVENGSQITDGIGYARLNKIYGNTEQDSLPAGYTALDYIESTGTQYIDTGVKVSTNNKIIADLLFTDVSRSQMNGGYYIYKIDNTSYTVRNDIGVGSTGFFFIGASVESITTNVTADTNRHTFMVNATTGEWAIDDVSGSVSPASHEDGSSNVLVGARQGTNTIGGVMPPQSYCYEKIYNVKIYNSGNLVRNLIPCKNLSDVVGMYDLVTNTFFTNSGTGDFIAGNEVTIPNPDYPLDVKVVTGDNTIKVEGKNLWNETELFSSYLDNGFYKFTSTEVRNVNVNVISLKKGFKDNTQYTLSCRGYFSGGVYANFAFFYTDGTNTQKYFPNGTNGDYFITSTAGKTVDHIEFRNVYNSTGKSTLIEQGTVQLELGNQATNYEPYQSQTYNLSLGSIELCKIGNYQDYIYKDNSKWYKHSEIGKVVLDGSEDYYSYSVDDKIVRFQARNMNNIAIPQTPYYSNNFTYMGSVAEIHESGITNGVSTTESRCFIFINKTIASTITAFKTWLSTHNTEAYYVLKTPTDEEITDTTLISQLETIYNFTMYLGVTNFTISSENSLPSLNITYATKDYDIYSKEETDDLLAKKTNKTYVENALNEKQNVLVSGTNIKTINNQSILGSGNINISGGSTYSEGNGINISDNEISVDTLVVQTTSNKVTSLSSSSTDTQYPSAKCVYDLIGDINSVLSLLTTPNNGGN